jgi:hypothetical protein
MKKIIKRSALQTQILNLYAQFVRLSKNQPGLLNKVRNEFRNTSHLQPKTDSLQIDYKLRRAKNQLEMLKTSNVQSIKVLSFNKPLEKK